MNTGENLHSGSIRDVATPEEVIQKWQSIVNVLAEIVDVPVALIMKVDCDYIEVFRSSESPGNPYKVGDREHLAGLYCEQVINTRNKLLVPNALKDNHWKNNPDIKLGMISYLGFPLCWPDGEVFGTICVLDLKENSYSETLEGLIIKFKEIIEIHLELIDRSVKNLFCESIEETLHDVLGEKGLKITCCFFRDKYLLEKDKLADDPEIFSKGLFELLGKPSVKIERKIQRRLHEKIRTIFRTKRDFKVVEHDQKH